jgi:hypothetical protein
MLQQSSMQSPKETCSKAGAHGGTAQALVLFDRVPAKAMPEFGKR